MSVHLYRTGLTGEGSITLPDNPLNDIPVFFLPVGMKVSKEVAFPTDGFRAFYPCIWEDPLAMVLLDLSVESWLYSAGYGKSLSVMMIIGIQTHRRVVLLAWSLDSALL